MSVATGRPWIAPLLAALAGGCPADGPAPVPIGPPVAPPGTCFTDADGDGHGDPGAWVDEFLATGPCVPVGDDCDDRDPALHPGQAEVCNSLDDDCDGVADEDAGVRLFPDSDGDGWGDEAAARWACAQLPGLTWQAGDCDDGDPTAFPGADERCNGRDDDCDGAIDEEPTVDALEWFADPDGDGWGDAARIVRGCRPPPGFADRGGDCAEGDPARHPAAPERCDGQDDDCDGIADQPDPFDVRTWRQDADGDGFPGTGEVRVACAGPAGFAPAESLTDCDDGRAQVHPGAIELCNGLDDDCDGAVDEDDAGDAAPWYVDTDGDGQGDPRLSVISCRPPRGYVSSPGDCDDLRAEAFLGADERCNGRDDDCDGAVDEDDAVDARRWYADRDGDGHGDPGEARPACARRAGWAATGDDCDDARAAAHPGAVEVCNGLDDDCDRATDEPDADDAITWYADLDRDGHGDPARPRDACAQPAGFVSLRGDCDDRDPAVHPGAGDPHDGKDNDCNGIIDDPAPGG